MSSILAKLSFLSKILAVMICVALVGYVGFLVVAYYRAQVELQESQRHQLTQEYDRRANAAGYFFSAQTNALKELAEAREIAIYFENQALGMSLEYGLNASLAAVQELFDKFFQKSRLEEHPIYTRILFLTPDGHTLALSADNDGASRQNWSKLLRRDRKAYFLSDTRRGGTRIMISLPCIFKGKLVGQVIGEIPLSVVYDHFVGNREGSSDTVALVMDDKYLFMPAAQQALLPLALRGAPPHLTPGAVTPLKSTDDPQSDILAIKTDITGTPMAIVNFIPADRYDTKHPRRILAVTACMAVAILAGIFVLFALTTRNSILKTRLEETALREREAEKQNRLLQSEIAERLSAEQRLSLALKGGDLGLWDWNMQTNRVDFNDRWAEMLDYSPLELEHSFTTFERLVHPDDSLSVMLAIQAHCADPTQLFEIEIRLRTSSGEWRWILSKGKVVESDTAGKPLRMTGTHLDITQRKNAEAALREQAETLEMLNRTLERRVHEEIEKRRAKELLVLQNEKLASIGQLAAGVAHEINNPMGFITANLRTLTDYFSAMSSFIEAQRTALEQTASPELRQELAATEKKLDVVYILEDGEELVKESLHGAQRVTRIVSDLRNFSRIDAPEYEETDLNTCLESTLNIVANELNSVATVVRETEPLPPVLCHPGQINQVFMNLLRNAGQAVTPPGTITLGSRHDAEFVFVEISDNGCGIPEQIRGRIFDPFFTTKDVGKGTGLGLSTSRDIVTHHNGEILVESSDKGTTFTVKLPRNTRQEADDS